VVCRSEPVAADKLHQFLTVLMDVLEGRRSDPREALKQSEQAAQAELEDCERALKHHPRDPALLQQRALLRQMLRLREGHGRRQGWHLILGYW